MQTRFSIVGLGKLGASMTGALASRGFDVVGVDAVPLVVEKVNNGVAPVIETGLQDLFDEYGSRIRATASYCEAVQSSDITFVVVPTPSDEQGSFSIQYAAEAFREIGRALAEKDKYHVVVLTSTVLPGATRFGLLPILERESGKCCGKDFGLCYSPEFIALGSVVRDFLNPDFTLVGESDPRAGARLEEVYSEVLLNSPPCRRMSFENAELAKVSLNAFVTMKISFANMLTELCERIPNGDVDAVSDAIGFDKRIGRRYLTGGLGFGGPCFPRDNIALAYFARCVGVDPLLPEATHAVNDKVLSHAVERVLSLSQPDQTVAVLGLSYKPMSTVVERSQGLEIAMGLAQAGRRVIGYDPLANEAAARVTGGAIELANSVAECIERADIVVLATPDPAFASLRPADFSHDGRPKKVVDFWRLLADSFDLEEDMDYAPAGRSSSGRRQNEDLLQEMWQFAAVAGG